MNLKITYSKQQVMHKRNVYNPRALKSYFGATLCVCGQHDGRTSRCRSDVASSILQQTENSITPRVIKHWQTQGASIKHSKTTQIQLLCCAYLRRQKLKFPAGALTKGANDLGLSLGHKYLMAGYAPQVCISAHIDSLPFEHEMWQTYFSSHTAATFLHWQSKMNNHISRG